MKNTQTFVCLGIVAISCLQLQACSVIMAASGSKEPNLGSVRTGASRGEIELHLGSPTAVSSKLNSVGSVATYEYEIGDEPSAGRAIGHAAGDLLTGFLWEIPGIIIEATRGEKRNLTIEYDNNDVVTKISAH